MKSSTSATCYLKFKSPFSYRKEFQKIPSHQTTTFPSFNLFPEGKPSFTKGLRNFFSKHPHWKGFPPSTFKAVKCVNKLKKKMIKIGSNGCNERKKKREEKKRFHKSTERSIKHTPQLITLSLYSVEGNAKLQS